MRTVLRRIFIWAGFVFFGFLTWNAWNGKIIFLILLAALATIVFLVWGVTDLIGPRHKDRPGKETP